MARRKWYNERFYSKETVENSFGSLKDLMFRTRGGTKKNNPRTKQYRSKKVFKDGILFGWMIQSRKK